MNPLAFRGLRTNLFGTWALKRLCVPKMPKQSVEQQLSGSINTMKYYTCVYVYNILLLFAQSTYLKMSYAEYIRSTIFRESS